MKQYLHAVTYLVDDYDKAIAWFTSVMAFELVEDEVINAEKRFVRVAPAGGGVSLLLARASTPEQKAAIGNQTGGRVMMFLHTDDFARDYDRLRAAGVDFIEEPRHEPFGTVVVFRDLYGQKWDLIERS